jgi:hypothetical protein
VTESYITIAKNGYLVPTDEESMDLEFGRKQWQSVEK